MLLENTTTLPNKDVITIRDFKKICIPQRQISVQAIGVFDYYYTGSLGDIPQRLLDAPVLEMGARAVYDDHPCANERFYARLSIWIAPIPDWIF